MLINFDNEPEKITLTLIFEDKESQISWNPKDTSLEDAKFMLVTCCAFVNYLVGVYSKHDNQ